MRIRLWAAISSALTVGIGLIVLLGLLLTPDIEEDTLFPDGTISTLNTIADALLQLVTIIVALTIFIGILNLLAVHSNRIIKRQRSGIYSGVLLVSFALVIITALIDREANLIVLETVQFSVESALAGIVFFALVYGAYRLLHHSVTWGRVLFVTIMLVVLMAAIPLEIAEPIRAVRDRIIDVPVSAGARGLLLGIALGTVVTGVRVLIGVDRSYRE